LLFREGGLEEKGFSQKKKVSAKKSRIECVKGSALLLESSTGLRAVPPSWGARLEGRGNEGKKNNKSVSKKVSSHKTEQGKFKRKRDHKVDGHAG